MTNNDIPAFPSEEEIANYMPDGKFNQMITIHHNGMTLRDWFAGQAVANVSNHIGSHEEFAKYCYLIADSMLLERSRKDSQNG